MLLVELSHDRSSAEPAVAEGEPAKSENWGWRTGGWEGLWGTECIHQGGGGVGGRAWAVCHDSDLKKICANKDEAARLIR